MLAISSRQTEPCCEYGWRSRAPVYTSGHQTGCAACAGPQDIYPPLSSPSAPPDQVM